MVGRRVALLVATDRYRDTGLSRLAAPASDARQLAAVLRDTRIAGFEVTTLYNKPHYVVGRAIGDFYRDRRGNDLTVLYFTGHGVKDEDGQLYLAMTDTDRENLPFTGVPSEQIRAAMEGSRSRQKVLVLDCCYAGAFPVGLGIKGDPAVHALEQLGGRGCVVLTSSDAMQLSFERNQVTETGPASLRSGPSSLFTRFLIEGLRTGKADLDGDGDITLDELYSYVHDRVTDEQPLQRPKKKEDIEGRICFAQNIYWTVPSRISDAANSPYPPGKLSALEELRSLHYRGNAIVKQRVLETVRLLAGDDSKSVSGAASQFLSKLIQQEELRPRGRGSRPARGRGDRAPPGRGSRPARGRGDRAPPGRGSRPARGRGDRAPPGRGSRPARGRGDRAPPGRGSRPARGRGDRAPPGRGSRPARGRGDRAPPGRGSRPARGRGDRAPPGRGSRPARGRGDRAPPGRGSRPARGRGDRAPPGRGSRPARGRGDRAPPGRGSRPARGRGDRAPPGRGSRPARGRGDRAPPGRGSRPARGRGDRAPPGRGSRPARGRGDRAPPGGSGPRRRPAGRASWRTRSPNGSCWD